MGIVTNRVAAFLGKFEELLGTLSPIGALCFDIGLLVLALMVLLYSVGGFFISTPRFRRYMLLKNKQQGQTILRR